MDKILEFLRAWFVKVYKMTDTEVTALFNADNFDSTAALTAISEKDKARVQQFQGKFQEGVNKGKSEALSGLEASLISKYGFENDTEHPLQGIDLIDAIVATKAAEGVKGDISKLTSDDLKKLPAFQPVLREHKKALTDAQKAAEDKVKEIEGSYKKKDVFAVVSKKGKDIVSALNPVLPKDQKVANRQLQAFIDSFGEYDFDIQDDVIVPMKDGKVATDGHGNALDFESLTKTRAAEWFEFSANNGGANGGNGRPGEGAGGAGGETKYPEKVTKPKTFEEMSKIVGDTSIPLADRLIVKQVFETELAAGTK